MKNIIPIIVAAVSLTGCRVEASVKSAPSTDGVALTDSTALPHKIGRVTLHKHPSGLCFAVVSTGGTAEGITNIPCQSGDTVFVR